MACEVVLAMLQGDGRWLMQLRDDIPGMVAQGCWGLFGEHLDPGRTPEQALRREPFRSSSAARSHRFAHHRGGHASEHDKEQM
jgi:ADP-ribose pyrophosphatase YjhB (NUDIX family)